MKVLKKSALSLAVAGVVYGTALTPVYADALKVTEDARVYGNIANDDTTPAVTTAIAENDTLEVEAGNTRYAGAASGSNALTIDVEREDASADGAGDAAAAALTLGGITINGNLDGTQYNNSGTMTAATGNGLVILDNTADFADTLASDITINGNITGKGFGVQVQVANAGDLVINEGKTVKGDIALELNAVNGSVSNAGKIEGSTASGGVGLNLKGAVSGGVTNDATGTISGETAIQYLNTLTTDTTFTNKGTITGNIAGRGTGAAAGKGLDFVNEGGGRITGATMDVLSLVNGAENLSPTVADESDAQIKLTGALTVTESIGNYGSIEANSVSAAGITNQLGGTISTLKDADGNGGDLSSSGAVNNLGTISVANDATVSGTATLTIGAPDTDSAAGKNNSNTSAKMTVGGDLTVGTGAAKNYGTLNVTGDANLGGTFTNGAADDSAAEEASNAISPTTIVGGTLDITGQADNWGSVTATGFSSAALNNAKGASIIINKKSDGTEGNFSAAATDNQGSISIAGTAGITGTGTLKIGEKDDTSTTDVNEANTAASMVVGGKLTVNNGAVTNYGTLTSAGIDFTTANALTNANMANVGKIGGLGATTITNTGTLGISEGSATVNLVGKKGTINLGYSSALTAGTTASINYGLQVKAGGKATFDKDSKFNVSLSGASLQTPGEFTLNALDVIDANGLEYTDSDDDTGAYDASTDTFTVTFADNALAKFSDKSVTADGISAKVTVSSAGDVVKGLGFSTGSQALASSLQAYTLDTDGSLVGGNGLNSAGQKSVTAVLKAYGSLIDNAASEAQLKTYMDNVRPDDSNSAAMSSASAGQAVMSNLSSRSAAVRTGANYGDMQASGGFWVQGLYGKSDQKAREGALAYKGDLRGMTFGLDREFGDSTTGIAFSYGKSDVDFSRDQKDIVKSYVASVYNIWEKGQMYVDTSLSVGSSKHESTRFNGAGTAKYGSMMLGGQAMVGYYFDQGGVAIEPKAGVRMTAVNVDDNSYKNADGDIIQSAQGVSYRQFDLGLGATISKALAVGNGTLTPSVGAMFYHDFVGDQLDTQVNFAGDNYSIKGASAVKNSWELNLGVSYAMGENLDLSAGYTRVMKNDFSSDNFNAKLKYMF